MPRFAEYRNLQNLLDRPIRYLAGNTTRRLRCIPSYESKRITDLSPHDRLCYVTNNQLRDGMQEPSGDVLQETVASIQACDAVANSVPPTPFGGCDPQGLLDTL
jgi:hypothetical protein